MIQKISNNDYMKRVDNMSAQERQSLKDRMSRWLSSGGRSLAVLSEHPSSLLQNAMQVCVSWNDMQCQAWNEGARLMTAFIGKQETWLPDKLYAVSAKRSIRKMFSVLKEEEAKMRDAGPVRPGKNTPSAAEKPLIAKIENPKATQAVSTGNPSSDVTCQTGGEPSVILPNMQNTAKEEPLDGTVQGTGAVAVQPLPSGEKQVPARPRHIDQYVHLLPAKTQERAAQYGPLMRDMEAARENLRLLMDDEHSKASDRERWAKTITKIDAQVKSIRKELDDEWDKLVQSGRVVVDDLGNARVVPVSGTPENGAGSTSQETENTELTKEQKDAIKPLRAWLRDNRGPKEPGEKHDAYVARWKEKYKEMVKIGGKGTVTEAVAKAAKLYGIDLAALDTEM